jgi:hypothetical protein
MDIKSEKKKWLDNFTPSTKDYDKMDSILNEINNINKL